MKEIIDNLYLEKEKVNEAIKSLCSKNPNDSNIRFLEGCLTTIGWMIEKVENHKCNCVVKNEQLEKQSKIKPCKIEVSSKTSEIIQEICFENDIYWSSGEKDTQPFSGYMYIYYSKTGNLLFIEQGSIPMFFQYDALPEIKDIDFIETYGNLDKQELRDLKLELKYKSNGEENAD